MTFDEAIEKAKKDLVYDDNVWGVWTDLLEDLKQEYAPTVEMTKEQSEDLNSIIREVGEVFEPNEIPAGVKLTDKVIELESSYILFKYLNAILHPEIIKIVDNEE